MPTYVHACICTCIVNLCEIKNSVKNNLLITGTVTMTITTPTITIKNACFKETLMSVNVIN